MSTITIKGTFESRVNSKVKVTIIGPQGYFKSKKFEDEDVDWPIDDLLSGEQYNISFSGSSPGKFEFSITGDITVDPTEGYSNAGPIACGDEVLTK